MPRNSTASLASALVAAAIVLVSWTSTLSLPSAQAAEVPSSASAHVILA